MDKCYGGKHPGIPQVDTKHEHLHHGVVHPGMKDVAANHQLPPGHKHDDVSNRTDSKNS